MVAMVLSVPFVGTSKPPTKNKVKGVTTTPIRSTKTPTKRDINSPTKRDNSKWKNYETINHESLDLT